MLTEIASDYFIATDSDNTLKTAYTTEIAQPNRRN